MIVAHRYDNMPALIQESSSSPAESVSQRCRERITLFFPVDFEQAFTLQAVR